MQENILFHLNAVPFSPLDNNTAPAIPADDIVFDWDCDAGRRGYGRCAALHFAIEGEYLNSVS